MSRSSPTGYIVQLLSGAVPCGVGTYIGNGYVLTAAHVVNRALARPPATSMRPTEHEIVSVRFPFLLAPQAVPTHVVDWSPPTAPASSSDACLLWLGSDAGDYPEPATLADLEDLLGTAVDIFGYPANPPRPNGAWSKATIGRRVPLGLIQLDMDPASAILAQPGYSGAPLVVPSRGHVVVGMFLSASGDASRRDGYAVTIDELNRSLPQLGSALRHSAFTSDLASMELGVSIVVGGRDTAALVVGDVLSGHLVDAVTAARGSTSGTSPTLLAELLEASAGDESTRRVLRHVFAKNAEGTAKPLLDGIMGAESNWGRASRCAERLTPSHAPYMATSFGELVGEAAKAFHFDVARMAIEGLGRMGVATWNRELIAFTELNDDYFRKLSSFTLPSLARMFAASDLLGFRAETERDHIASAIASFVNRNAARLDGMTWRLFGGAVVELRPWHADAIIRYWLESDEPELVSAAARAIGHMRLRRGISSLAGRLHDGSSEVASTVAREIGRVGGPRAVEVLDAALDSPSASRQGVIDGLTLSLPFAPSDGFRARAEFCISHAGQWATLFAYRALGVRAEAGCSDLLRLGLEHRDGAVRGAACLALARVEGRAALDAVATAHREATDHIELVQTSLALVTLGTDPDELDLGHLLYAHLLDYDIEVFSDVVTTLETCGGQGGQDMAAAARWLRGAS